MDTKKNMSREQLLAYMRDNCTEAEAQQVRKWPLERLKDPALDQRFSDLLDATETEYDPERKERVRRKLHAIPAASPAPNSPPRSGNLRRWRWSLRIIEYAAAVAAVVLALHYRHQANTPREWVEVYAGTRYGTLKSEMERIWRKGNIILFDVDVMGGIRLKSIFGANALSIFVMPPSVAALRERLTGRGTDSPETIEKRIAKAEQENSYADRFDYVVINDDLQQAIAEVETLVAKFIKE